MPARLPLSRDRILAAALAFADAHGVDALSMRKLGQALGVQAMSLYNHVANKDEVLDGITNLVVAEIELPDPALPWREAMRRRAQSAHAVLMAHPWASAQITSRTNIGPAMLRYTDATLGVLLAAGFSPAQVDHAWNALDSYVYGFTLQALNFPFAPDEYADAAAEYLPKLPADEYPHMVRLARLVADGQHDGINRLAFGLDLLLDGLERMLRLEG